MHSSITSVLCFCSFHFLWNKISIFFSSLCFCFFFLCLLDASSESIRKWVLLLLQPTTKEYAGAFFYYIYILFYFAFSILRAAHSKIIRSFHIFHIFSSREAFRRLTPLQSNIHTLRLQPTYESIAPMGSAGIGSTSRIQIVTRTVPWHSNTHVVTPAFFPATFDKILLHISTTISSVLSTQINHIHKCK